MPMSAFGSPFPLVSNWPSFFVSFSPQRQKLPLFFMSPMHFCSNFGHRHFSPRRDYTDMSEPSRKQSALSSSWLLDHFSRYQLCSIYNLIRGDELDRIFHSFDTSKSADRRSGPIQIHNGKGSIIVKWSIRNRQMYDIYPSYKTKLRLKSAA